MSLLLNGGLILGWGLSLALALGSDITSGPLWLLIGLVLLRTQLQTGLFIVATGPGRAEQTVHGVMGHDEQTCLQLCA